MNVSYDPRTNELVARGFSWTRGQGSCCRLALRGADEAPVSAEALSRRASEYESVSHGEYERRIRIAGRRYGPYHRKLVRIYSAYFDPEGRLIPDSYQRSRELFCVRYSLRYDVVRTPLRDGFDHVSLRVRLNEDMAAGDLIVRIGELEYPVPVAVKRGARWLPGFEVLTGERTVMTVREALRDCCDVAGR